MRSSPPPLRLLLATLPLSTAASRAAGATLGIAASAPPASAALTKESEWPLWLALPVAPYSRRKTIRREVVPGVWAFDQLIGIYYVHVPIRMTECLSLLQPLIDAHGPVKTIILPSVAVEHKVNAGPFARAFPAADFYAVDQQYSFPLPLPAVFLGLPSWTKPLPRSSEGLDATWLGGEFEHADVALYHRPSKTLLLCDAVLSVTEEPPPILTSDPEYARDDPLELVADTAANRRKGWRRIVLLFNFFIPGATQASFARYSANGRPTLLPIIQIILNRTVQRWDFERVVPAHLDAPIAMGPAQFAEPFDFARDGGNEVRFCDEDVALLREAEKGPLSFSVGTTALGPLTGAECALGNSNPRIVSAPGWTPLTGGLKWTPK
ncbi:hypothetical protein EMIHUDRAFT_200596 [Emiliania huxleyi CCMP1516]|uniref:Uncharacterized protein n=2 Tax=Emiliania huxleyi TaxID=2903 RepID=A0A0D3KQU3_EMIH1|nr:hypothetical protein EMIHUDRAFT_200596 [Emiliania huxleyi CCMP1516]EOD38128.1 hypothetical protein EMIHUDRAFT_200596 [Emiliania huxleyi CCMP1516]|eukprot:XP_005790557.1 hypothetical protein EMIHUDRAFT_200596 [Emiliania huxleyi CCMP1516]